MQSFNKSLIATAIIAGTAIVLKYLSESSLLPSTVAHTIGALLYMTLAILAGGLLVYAALSAWRYRSNQSYVLFIVSLLIALFVVPVWIKQARINSIQTMQKLAAKNNIQETPQAASTITTEHGIGIVTSKAELDAVVATKKPVVVKAYAKWCGPCKKMTPIYQAVAQELKEQVTFLELDVDAFKDEAALKISAIPAFIGFKDGKELARTIGEKSEQELKNFALQLVK